MIRPSPEHRMREHSPEQIEARPGLSGWHPVSLLATWFGSGLLPWLPGTWGSLAALPFAWIVVGLGGPWALVAALVLVFAVGVWAADVYSRRAGIDDPGAIVIDEVVGQWLVLLVVPPDPLLYVLGFIVFRTLDIWKPWPVRWADRYVKGGLGVMLDDSLAAIYGVPLMALLAWIAA